MGSRICIMNGGKVVQVGRAARGLPAAGQHLRGELPRQSADEPAARPWSPTTPGGRGMRVGAWSFALPAPTACRRCRPAPTSSSASGRRRFPARRARRREHRGRDRPGRAARRRDDLRRPHCRRSKSRSSRASVRTFRSRSASGASSASISPPRMCSTPKATRCPERARENHGRARTTHDPSRLSAADRRRDRAIRSLRRPAGWSTRRAGAARCRTGSGRCRVRSRFVGTALTVRTRPVDNLAPYAALKFAKPGDVLVVAVDGSTRRPASSATSCSAWRRTPASSPA